MAILELHKLVLIDFCMTYEYITNIIFILVDTALNFTLNIIHITIISCGCQSVRLTVWTADITGITSSQILLNLFLNAFHYCITRNCTFVEFFILFAIWLICTSKRHPLLVEFLGTALRSVVSFPCRVICPFHNLVELTSEAGPWLLCQTGPWFFNYLSFLRILVVLVYSGAYLLSFS